MRDNLIGITLWLAVALPCWSQLPQTQEQYWQQVDQQMRQQEQERWAQEITEQGRIWEEQQAWEQQQEQERYLSDQQPRQDSMGTLLRQSAAMAGVSRDLLLDPNYAKFREGFWEYHSLGDQYRSAMFINPKGMISVHGPGGSYSGALLMLWGPNIPAPAKIATVQVALKQNEEAVQTVKTFNYGFPGVGGWGTLIFVVPSARALVDNMEDVQRFEARIAGQVVFSSEWHDGKVAAGKL